MPGAAPPKPLPFAPGDLVLDYSLEQRAHAFVDSFDRAVEQWSVKVTAETGDDGAGPERVYQVGWSSVTLLRDDSAVDLYEVLDAVDGDHETIGATIFDADTGDLAPAREEKLMLPAGDILMCDRTWVEPQYRGHDLGVVIKAMTIRV